MSPEPADRIAKFASQLLSECENYLDDFDDTVTEDDPVAQVLAERLDEWRSALVGRRGANNYDLRITIGSLVGMAEELRRQSEQLSCPLQQAIRASAEATFHTAQAVVAAGEAAGIGAVTPLPQAASYELSRQVLLFLSEPESYGQKLGAEKRAAKIRQMLSGSTDISQINDVNTGIDHLAGTASRIVIHLKPGGDAAWHVRDLLMAMEANAKATGWLLLASGASAFE